MRQREGGHLLNLHGMTNDAGDGRIAELEIRGAQTGTWRSGYFGLLHAAGFDCPSVPGIEYKYKRRR